MDKTELKSKITTLAGQNGISLPKGWANKSDENLAVMLDEMIAEYGEIRVEEKAEKVEAEVIEQNLSPIEIDRINKSFLKQLQAEEYVDIEIDPTPMYPEGSTVPIGLNGVTFRVPVGQYFEKGVPKSIKEVWNYSKTETRKANNAIKRKLNGEIKIQ